MNFSLPCDPMLFYSNKSSGSGLEFGAELLITKLRSAFMILEPDFDSILNKTFQFRLWSTTIECEDGAGILTVQVIAKYDVDDGGNNGEKFVNLCNQFRVSLVHLKP